MNKEYNFISFVIFLFLHPDSFLSLCVCVYVLLQSVLLKIENSFASLCFYLRRYKHIKHTPKKEFHSLSRDFKELKHTLSSMFYVCCEFNLQSLALKLCVYMSFYPSSFTSYLYNLWTWLKFPFLLYFCFCFSLLWFYVAFFVRFLVHILWKSLRFPICFSSNKTQFWQPNISIKKN